MNRIEILTNDKSWQKTQHTFLQKNLKIVFMSMYNMSLNSKCTTLQTKTLLYNFICFLYNSCIPEYAYTILYTVISNEIFFQWFFYQMYTESFFCHIVYLKQSFLFTNTNQIPIILTYTKLHYSKKLCLGWCG